MRNPALLAINRIAPLIAPFTKQFRFGGTEQRNALCRVRHVAFLRYTPSDQSACWRGCRAADADAERPLSDAARCCGGASAVAAAAQSRRRLRRVFVRRSSASAGRFFAAAHRQPRTSDLRQCRSECDAAAGDDAAFRYQSPLFAPGGGVSGGGSAWHYRDRYAQQVFVFGGIREESHALWHRRRPARLRVVG